MKIIGLTGGIGSGKTTVANMFQALGVPIYIADLEAKKLMNRSVVIRRKLIEVLGPGAYKEEHLDRDFVAKKVFHDAGILAKVNAVVHPKVQSHFTRWIKKQHGFYCIKEAAILFENGGYLQCDKNILVIAPKSLRMERVMNRDHITSTEVQARMNNQWSDEKKIPLADFVINNEHWEETQKRVLELHKLLLKEESY